MTFVDGARIEEMPQQCRCSITAQGDNFSAITKTCSLSGYVLKSKWKQGSTLLLTKNSRTFQDPQNVPGLCCSPAMLNYRKTAVTYSVYTVW